MQNLDICVCENCGNQKHSFYDGKPLCPEHYREAILKDMYSEYERWLPQSGPSPRFVYLLGRFYDEFATVSADSYLSAARIRDRGFAFQKTPEGCSFSITRHLNAWTETKPMSLSVETWEVVWKDESFRKLGDRPWHEGDRE